MKTKTNKVPLVGPKGRKELLKRINELEEQVAQQDYLTLVINDPTDPTEEEKAEIVKHLQNGTIWDCIVIQYDGGVLGRVVAVHKLELFIVVADPEDGGLINIDYDLG